MAEEEGDVDTDLVRAMVYVANGDIDAQTLEVEHRESEPLFVAVAHTDVLCEGDVETHDVCDNANECVGDEDIDTVLVMVELEV